MTIRSQEITDRYALYNGDCIQVMATLPDKCIHFSLYSPPFCGLYHYSSSEHDLSNCRTYEEFFVHYEFIVKEIDRLTIPGRLSGVHCMDIPNEGACSGYRDFPGDIIRLHERLGWRYFSRHCVWKEPLGVRNRTMARGLAHRQIVDDSTLVDVASADYLLLFRKNGKNAVPVRHNRGLLEYAGERQIPSNLLHLRGSKGKQIENRYSHWIWRQYASAFWDDVRLDRVLPYKEARESGDDRHQHPLQLDVIERCIELRSNPGEKVLTPFMGVGSEVYGAVINGRRGIGIELKTSYYNQAKKNVQAALKRCPKTSSLFENITG